MRKSMIAINSTAMKSDIKAAGLKLNALAKTLGVSYVGLQHSLKVGRMSRKNHEKLLKVLGQKSPTTNTSHSADTGLEDLVMEIERRGWRVTLQRL
jgi:hypothetical protein